MIKIEYTDVYGFDTAIRGMRNPMNSWSMSDSKFDGSGEAHGYSVGDNDLSLMKRLVSAGEDHSKFMRMINVTCDITAPLYWWKEFDTYKVGTVANSCSTMHKLHAKELTLDDFSHEHLDGYYLNCLHETISMINVAREEYLECKVKKDWYSMIQLLPTSYNQRRTVQLNYAVLRNMYYARRAHKLNEWREFCEWIEKLPYFNEICIGGEKDEN